MRRGRRYEARPSGLGGLGEPDGGEAVRRRTGEGGRKERVERETDLSDSNLNFSQNFQLTLEKF